MKTRTKILSAFAGAALAGAAFAPAVAPAAPAEAYSGEIIYRADCPGTAKSQQLVVLEDNRYDDIREHSLIYGNLDHWFYSEWKQIWNTYDDAPVGSNITYAPVQYRDVYSYKFVDAHWAGRDMSLNWTYHVNCFY